MVSDSWEKNWIYSKHPGKEFGKFVRTAGKFFHDEEEDKGMYEIANISCFRVFIYTYLPTLFSFHKIFIY